MSVFIDLTSRADFFEACRGLARNPRSTMHVSMIEPRTPAAAPAAAESPEAETPPAPKRCQVCGGEAAFHDIYCVNCRHWMSSYGRASL